ncbi:MAG: hypothetical protein VR72_18560 [Clostridiaceae bacterium BRH_c20a]|nr:MAG: hypothetical protein VR72_18560 [Clostridiaceae bacterium BRH_c20a]
MESMYFITTIITIFGGFTIAILAILTDHKQKMLLIERGLIEEKKPYPGLRSGLTFTLLGIISLLIFRSWTSIFQVIPWYSPGAVFLAFGVAQLSYYFLIKRDANKLDKTYSDRAL